MIAAMEVLLLLRGQSHSSDEKDSTNSRIYAPNEKITGETNKKVK